MKWKIVYYNKRVYQDVVSLPETLLGSFLAYANVMKDHGPNLGMPLWILHSFVKKTQQTPKSELGVAKKRLKEVKEND